MNTTFEQISKRIIKEQELIIGPIAWEEAGKVPGLIATKGEVSVIGDGKEVVNKLVAQYERLFGKISQEVCKSAVRDLLLGLSQDQIPSSLM